VQTASAIGQIAAGANSAFVPQCGLAPGFVNIVAADLMRRFDAVRTVKLRVGALPQYPANALKYALTWSTEGLINEYGNPCLSIVNGMLREVPPLDDVEILEIDGITYEAFNTSGGLGTLVDSFGAGVESMDYKTIRYPGHCEQMRLLMFDLRLNEDRETLRRILDNALPTTQDDMVVVQVSVTGLRNGELATESYVSKMYPQVIAGRQWTAIQVTTAAGICALVDLVLDNPENYQGFVRQEQFKLDAFFANRFGQHYLQGMRRAISEPNSIGLGFLWTLDWGSIAVRRSVPDEQIESTKR
jgi:saccharopine dehydrogenase-like NADP-dependent oxidoreductase